MVAGGAGRTAPARLPRYPGKTETAPQRRLRRRQPGRRLRRGRLRRRGTLRLRQQLRLCVRLRLCRRRPGRVQRQEPLWRGASGPGAYPGNGEINAACPKSLAEFAARRRQIKCNPFFAAACTSQKTLLILQVWNLFAHGEQIMRAADCKPFVKKGPRPFLTSWSAPPAIEAGGALVYRKEAYGFISPVCAAASGPPPGQPPPSAAGRCTPPRGRRRRSAPAGRRPPAPPAG